MDEKMNVLVIDDNKELANALKDAINNYNDKWNATSVYDGSSALNLMSTNPPDIVFCDIVLPDMSGIDVMKNIKDIEQDIQVIIMTAYASLSTAIEALQFGAFDYIPKPLHINQVINAIKSAEKRRKNLLENRRMITNLLSIKDENKISDETREIIERLMILKHFQKRISIQETKKTLLESSYKELAKIFQTEYINIIIKGDDDKFRSEMGPKSGDFKIGEFIDIRMPTFYLPVKNGIGCVFPGEKSMTSVIGFENKIMGLVYYKRERDFSQGELETAEVIAIEIGAKLTEIMLNRKIDSERVGTLLAFLSVFGITDPEEKRRASDATKMAVEFAEYLNLKKDDIERVRYSAMLYNVLEASAVMKFKKKGEFSKKIDEIIEGIDFISNSKDIIISVSENYDGSGKPKGLKQNEIPIGARILKIVATFVLLVANNTYRAGEKEDLTLLHMEQKKGGYFDPDLLGRFREYILERRSRIL